MSYSIITEEGDIYNRIKLKCNKCGDTDKLTYKTIFEILNPIGKEEQRYAINGKNGEGWRYVARYVFACCNPNITYETLERTFKIPNNNTQNNNKKLEV